MTLVQLKSITKKYQQANEQHTVLQQIDVSIHEGEFIAICGPSGHGKSTLLSILALLEPATSGEYLLAGTSVSSLHSNQRAILRGRHIGIVFQSFNLIGDMTVKENVQLPLKFAKHIDHSKYSQLVKDAIAAVGLSDKENFYPDMLSGGQQQRVAIARAIVHQPDILFADEPTGNLDSATGQDVMTLLKTLHKKGMTLCLVTHDQAIAAQAQRVFHMQNGHLTETN